MSIVDDDDSVRESLPDLVRELGFRANAFASAHEFLSCADLATTQCLLLDIAMPGTSGLELYVELRKRGRKIPTIFITGRSDGNLRSRLIADGAVECLFKPFSDQQLRAALHSALDSP